jgi:hypothetical protein
MVGIHNPFAKFANQSLPKIASSGSQILQAPNLDI